MILTDRELRELALKVSEGRVVGTWLPQFQNQDGTPAIVEISCVFMPLALMSAQQLSDAGNWAHAYGVLGEDETSGRSFNGMPIFYTFHFLMQEDNEKLWPLVQEIQGRIQSFMNPNAQDE